MANVRIPIEKDVAHQPLRLSKTSDDRAEWVTNDDSYTVDFKNDCPFEGASTYDVTPNGPTLSRKIRGDAQVRTYHYFIKKTHASQAAAPGDPDVEILP